jgi:hypothetical protein
MYGKLNNISNKRNTNYLNYKNRNLIFQLIDN